MTFAPWIFIVDLQDGLTCKIPVELDSDGKTGDASILKQAICVDCDPNDHCQWGRLDINLVERRSIGSFEMPCSQLVIVNFA